MPTYTAQVILEDSYGRQTRKSFLSQDLLDFATAQAALTALVTDLQSVTELGVVRTYLTEEVVIDEAPTGGSNVDEGATLSVKKVDTKKHSLKWPAPVGTLVLTDGSLDLTNAALLAYVENFQAAGDWTVSDGELIASIVKGSVDEN